MGEHDRVKPFAAVDVEEVDPDRFDFQQDFVLFRCGPLQRFENERLGAAVLVDADCVHGASLGARLSGYQTVSQKALRD
jgi:hypothetical protein